MARRSAPAIVFFDRYAALICVFAIGAYKLGLRSAHKCFKLLIFRCFTTRWGTLPPLPSRTPMKTDMFSSLKVIHGAARSTALSVAVSLVVAAAFATPVSTFAATPAATEKTSKHAKAAKKPRLGRQKRCRASRRRPEKEQRRRPWPPSDDDAPRASAKRKRVSFYVRMAVTTRWCAASRTSRASRPSARCVSACTVTPGTALDAALERGLCD